MNSSLSNYSKYSVSFCPGLKVISDMMGLSENVAGVTLLAFGNCAPDMITSFSGLSGDTRVVYTDTMGSAIFVLFVVGGSVIVSQPFHTDPSAFLRDCGFALFAVVFVSYTFFTDDSVTLVEAIRKIYTRNFNHHL